VQRSYKMPVALTEALNMKPIGYYQTDLCNGFPSQPTTLILEGLIFAVAGWQLTML
jgi:hypothetical protein